LTTHVIDHLLRTPGLSNDLGIGRSSLLLSASVISRGLRSSFWSPKANCGAVEYLRLLKLAMSGGERLEVMLADYLSPPYPLGVWRSYGHGALLQPDVRPPTLSWALAAGLDSYDALLKLELEVFIRLKDWRCCFSHSACRPCRRSGRKLARADHETGLQALASKTLVLERGAGRRELQITATAQESGCRRAPLGNPSMKRSCRPTTRGCCPSC